MTDTLGSELSLADFEMLWDRLIGNPEPLPDDFFDDDEYYSTLND